VRGGLPKTRSPTLLPSTSTAVVLASYYWCRVSEVLNSDCRSEIMAYEVDWLMSGTAPPNCWAAEEVGHRKITADARGGKILAGMRQIFFSIITREAVRRGTAAPLRTHQCHRHLYSTVGASAVGYSPGSRPSTSCSARPTR
jgi:hypothetical protein